MKQEFGVRFEIDIIQYTPWNLKGSNPTEIEATETTMSFEDYLQEDDFFELLQNAVNIYVAKESEEIFEAKHDDLGLTKKDLLPCVFNFKNNWMGLSTVGDYGIKEDEECFIIMRDNKNFLACEVEK